MPKLLIRVGSKDRPASDEDIADIQRVISAAKLDPSLVMVTHHLVSFEHLDCDINERLVFKLGDDERPASDEDTKDLQLKIARAVVKSTPVITNHAVAVERVRL